MATYEEAVASIEESERQLSASEIEQRKFASSRIPVRRYGAGVDVRQQQQQVLLQRETARKNLAAIQAERERLKAERERLKGQRASEEAAAEQRRQEEVRIKLARRGAKVGGAYYSGSSVAQYRKAQGLPEVKSGTIEGGGTYTITTIPPQYIAPIRSIDTNLGPITLKGFGVREVSYNQIENYYNELKIEQSILQQKTITQTKLYSSMVKFGRAALPAIYIVPYTIKTYQKYNPRIVLKTSSYPIGYRLRIGSTKNDEVSIGLLKQQATYRLSKNINIGSTLGAGAISFIPETAGGVAASTIGVGAGMKFAQKFPKLFNVADVAVTSYYGYRAKKAKTFEEASTASFVAVSGAVGLGARGGKAAYRYYFKTPIKIYEVTPQKRYISKDIIIAQEGKPASIAEFKIRGTAPAREFVVVTRADIIRRGIETGDTRDVMAISKTDLSFLMPIPRLTPEQASMLYPYAKKYTLGEPQYSLLLSNKFAISPTGDILIPARTLAIRKGARFSPFYVSQLRGGIGTQSINARNYPRQSREVQEQIRALLEVRTGVPVSKQNVPILLGKFGEIKLGAAESSMLLKLPRTKPYSLIPSGKRTSRVNLAFLTEELPKPKRMPKEYRLKIGKGLFKTAKISEVEYFRTITGLQDVTQPRFKVPKTDVISGRTKIISLKGDEDLVGIKRYNALYRVIPRQKQTLKQLESLAEVKAAAIKGLPKQRQLSQRQIIKTLTPQIQIKAFSMSIYAGRGLYERTANIASFNLDISRQLPREITRTIPKEVPITTSRVIPKMMPREVARTIPKEVPREIARTIPREITRIIPRIIPREITRMLPKTPPKIPIKFPPRISPRTPPKKINFIPSMRIKGTMKKERGSINVLLRRFGKFTTIGRGLSASSALRLGKQKAETTLGRTIRFTGSERELRRLNKDTGFFRLPRGKSKLKAPYTYIERSKYALNVPSEIRAIQSARKIKGGLI